MSSLRSAARDYITLNRFILEQQQAHPEATGEFSILLAQIGLAAKFVASEMSQGALAGVLGATDDVNVQGEVVSKLDVLANEAFVDVFRYIELVSTVGSEEMETPAHVSAHGQGGRYFVLVDPLDGSSNIDANGTVGSIFSIRRRHASDGEIDESDLLRPGAEQVAAGYVLYGPSTMLVYTTGEGTHGFTLDTGIGEFLLTHHDIRIPDPGGYYSANEARYGHWDPAVQAFVDELRDGGYSSRYSGALVHDLHRILLEGGLYFYPPTSGNPDGKLRLMYEAAPLAFVVEQAGGAASTGRKRIRDVPPTGLHQRVPLFIGGRSEIERVETLMRSGE
ncbi:MAG: class 1 fructose-bisphosphatase [Candidatus Bipolaricaulia bacterium]